MERNVSTRQQLERERATYRYLTALDTGDIDTIIAVLQQAAYDASLEHTVLDTHQAYFQADALEQTASLVEQDTQLDLPTLEDLEPRPRRPAARPKRHSWWGQTLAAVLIVVVLIGGFVALLNWHNPRSGQTAATPTSAVSVCSPYIWRQFDRTYSGVLNSVAAISVDDAWAVGYEGDGGPTPGSSIAAIEHWDGKNWQEMPNPATTANTSSILTHVAAVSAKDVWAVGYIWQGQVISQNEGLPDLTKTLIEHWDGSNWSVVPSPNGTTGNGMLNALTVISANDIWAAGSFNDASQVPHLLLEHWNGAAWQIVPIQANNVVPIGMVLSIMGTSSHNLWMAGLAHSGSQPQAGGFVAHWDGKQWTWLSVPDSVNITDVAIDSASDLWVTSYTRQDGSELLRWNGQTWSKVPLPVSLSNTELNLSGIVALSTDNLWLVGYQGIANNQDAPFILHWDGKSWQKEQFPALQGTMINAIALVNGQTWAVGTTNIGSEGGNGIQYILGQRTCP